MKVIHHFTYTLIHNYSNHYLKYAILPLFGKSLLEVIYVKSDKISTTRNNYVYSSNLFNIGVLSQKHTMK